MPEIQLGDDFAIDANIATKRTLLLGQPETGKTNAATVIGEGLLKLGVPVTVLDWKGDLWGMRSSADGERAGFPVVIFGGDHADVEITDVDGREIGHLVAKDEMPTVIDCSDFVTDAERRRFYTAFLKAFLHAKRDAVRPHTLLIDEFQEFAPQRPYGEGIQLLGATQQLAGLGRKRGIGIIGTALRAAQLSKNFVEISDLYLFMQIAGKNDLQSIKDTIGSRATADELKTILTAIPRLAKGEVVAYSPAWLRILEQRRFRLRETFDSSRTPQVGETLSMLEPHAFAKIDVPALSARIAATREAREAEDPVALRARIADLEKKIGARLVVEDDHQVCHEDLTAMQRGAEVAERDTVGAQGQLAKIVGHVSSIKDALRDHVLAGEKAMEIVDDLLADATRTEFTWTATAPPLEPRPEPLRHSAAPERIVTSRSAEGSNEPGTVSIKAGARRMLEQLARCGGTLSKAQLAVLAGVNRGSGTFSDYLGALRRSGYITDDSHSATVTSEGCAFADVKIRRAPPSTAEIVAIYKPKVKAGAQRMLDLLVAAYPKSITKADLATQSGVNRQSGTFSDYLGSLRRLGLIEDDTHSVRAGSTLYPGAR